MKKTYLLFLVLFFSTSAVAQQTGEILGSVVDGDGEPLPGVLVTAESPEIVQLRTTVSDASGHFRFRLLPPGDYMLTATMTGMKTSQQNLRIGLGEVAKPEFVLTPEAVEE